MFALPCPHSQSYIMLHILASIACNSSDAVGYTNRTTRYAGHLGSRPTSMDDDKTSQNVNDVGKIVVSSSVKCKLEERINADICRVFEQLIVHGGLYRVNENV